MEYRVLIWVENGWPSVIRVHSVGLNSQCISAHEISIHSSLILSSQLGLDITTKQKKSDMFLFLQINKLNLPFLSDNYCSIMPRKEINLYNRLIGGPLTILLYGDYDQN